MAAVKGFYNSRCCPSHTSINLQVHSGCRTNEVQKASFHWWTLLSEGGCGGRGDNWAVSSKPEPTGLPRLLCLSPRAPRTGLASNQEKEHKGSHRGIGKSKWKNSRDTLAREWETVSASWNSIMAFLLLFIGSHSGFTKKVNFLKRKDVALWVQLWTVIWQNRLSSPHVLFFFFFLKELNQSNQRCFRKRGWK